MLSVVVAFTTLRQRKPSAEVLSEHPIAVNERNATVPVLVELFTSEGCSSCPPADDLLSKLVKTDTIAGVEVIALGEHVDYWNNLGWTDPYSKPDFSQRQRSYSEAFNLDSVYTPQLIVDGHEQLVGGDWNRAHAAILKAAATQKGRINLALTTKAGLDQNSLIVKLTIDLKDLPSRSGEESEVLFAITEDNLRSQVSRGENSGRYLQHSAVVRELDVLGNIASHDETLVTEKSINLSPGWRRENLRAIAFVQERRSRRVIAAGTLLINLSNPRK